MKSFKAHRRQIFCVLGCLAAFALCLWVWLTASGAFTPASAVVLFTDKNGAAYLDSDRLAQQLTDCTLYTLDAEGDAAAQLEELQRTQKRKTVRAAIVAADDRTTAASLAQQLAQTGLPVILAGAAPEEGLVETGNIWYVGSDPASGGELLGAALAADWNSGILPDLNGDYLMQYILRGQEETSLSNPLLQAVLNECEHYGIFSNPVQEEPDQTLSDELSQIEQAQQDARDGETPAADAEDIPVVLSLGSTPEAILFGGPESGQAALEEAAQQGWTNGEAPSLLAGFALNELQARQLAEAGVARVVYYDLPTVTDTAAALTINLLAERPPIEGLDELADGHCLYLPMRLLED